MLKTILSSIGTAISSLPPVWMVIVLLGLSLIGAVVFLALKDKIILGKKDNKKLVKSKQKKLACDMLRKKRHMIEADYRKHVYEYPGDYSKDVRELNFVCYKHMMKVLFNKIYITIMECVTTNGFTNMNVSEFNDYIQNVTDLIYDDVISFLNESYNSDLFIIPIQERLNRFDRHVIEDLARKYFLTAKQLKKTFKVK